MILEEDVPCRRSGLQVPKPSNQGPTDDSFLQQVTALVAAFFVAGPNRILLRNNIHLSNPTAPEGTRAPSSSSVPVSSQAVDFDAAFELERYGSQNSDTPKMSKEWVVERS